MTIVSVNVGRPRQVRVGNRTVLRSIWKSPVSGRVAVRRHNVASDVQADLTVRGGPYKALYCYWEEHYAYWRAQLPNVEPVAGNFGI